MWRPAAGAPGLSGGAHGEKVEEQALKKRLARSRRTLEKFGQFQSARAGRYLPADLVSPLYCGMTNNILLGTEEEESYVDMLLQAVKSAPPAQGKRIYWMHTIPFWSGVGEEGAEVQPAGADRGL